MQFQHFGEFLRHYRVRAGFPTQPSMRARLLEGGFKISATQFSSWEVGHMVPTRRHFQAIIALLDLTPEERNEANRLFADAPVAERGGAEA